MNLEVGARSEEKESGELELTLEIQKWRSF
jgi:hypothetical protein